MSGSPPPPPPPPPPRPPLDGAELARVHRDESALVLAALIRELGDFDRAEDALQEAWSRALVVWPRDGVPGRPGGWLLTVARRAAIDVARRERRRPAVEEQAGRHRGAVPGPDELLAASEEAAVALPDERLRLLFTCCHPALARESQVALTLRTLGGLSTDEIAAAFLLRPPTIAQRLVRAKARIRRAGIPYRVPDRAELPERLPPVLTVLYLVFNEGYTASAGEAVVRHDLCGEAIRLAGILQRLMPGEPEIAGLRALMLLHDARSAARTDADGLPVLLEEQDRSRWDQGGIAGGLRILDAALAQRRPGPFQVQAAIAAVHASAEDVADTDWTEIVALYDVLLRMQPGPVIALNRALAIAMRDGPATGLRLLEEVAKDERLSGYHYVDAARGELLRRLGRPREARAALERAQDATGNAAEQAWLAGRIAQLDGAEPA